MKEKFRIIPAIDLLDGRVVRLLKGDYSRSTVYSDNPAEQAEEFIFAGVDLIHVVDLSAARAGDRTANRSAIKEILKTAEGKAMLQIGGGIRDISSAQEYLESGVHRCILGTGAVENPSFAEDCVKKFGADRIIAGVDALKGRVKVAGWEKDGGREAGEFLKEMESRGIRTVIFTDIATDGAMTGPNIESLKIHLKNTSMEFIASGGVSSLDDIKKLLSVGNPRLVGAITGRAVYEKKLDLRQAVDLGAGGRSTPDS